MVTTVKLLLFLGFAASCLAAPLANNDGQCKPIGEPTKLLSYRSLDKAMFQFQSNGKGRNPKLIAVDNSTEKFQFYECPRPSKDYYKRRDGYIYGQLHSVTHPGKCLTAGNTWVFIGSDNAGGANYKYIPNGDGTIRMYDCETTDSDIMRRQWMGSSYKSGYGKCKLPYFFQEGRKEDRTIESLTGYTDEKGHKSALFDVPWKYPVLQAYLVDELPEECL